MVMKNLLLKIMIFSILSCAAKANEWNIISKDLSGYNFYTNSKFLGGKF